MKERSLEEIGKKISRKGSFASEEIQEQGVPSVKGRNHYEGTCAAKDLNNAAGILLDIREIAEGFRRSGLQKKRQRGLGMKNLG